MSEGSVEVQQEAGQEPAPEAPVGTEKTEEAPESAKAGETAGFQDWKAVAKSARDEAARYRVERNTLRDAQKALLEQVQGAADLTAVTEHIKGLEQALAAREAEAQRQSAVRAVMAEFSLPAAVGEFLTEASEEGLRRQAEALRGLWQGQAPVGAVSGGIAPTEAPFDASEIAQKLRSGRR